MQQNQQQICQRCNKVFKNERGLKIHQSRYCTDTLNATNLELLNQQNQQQSPIQQVQSISSIQSTSHNALYNQIKQSVNTYTTIGELFKQQQIQNDYDPNYNPIDSAVLYLNKSICNKFLRNVYEIDYNQFYVDTAINHCTNQQFINLLKSLKDTRDYCKSIRDIETELKVKTISNTIIGVCGSTKKQFQLVMNASQHKIVIEKSKEMMQQLKSFINQYDKSIQILSIKTDAIFLYSHDELIDTQPIIQFINSQKMQAKVIHYSHMYHTHQQNYFYGFINAVNQFDISDFIVKGINKKKSEIINLIYPYCKNSIKQNKPQFNGLQWRVRRMFQELFNQKDFDTINRLFSVFDKKQQQYCIPALKCNKQVLIESTKVKANQIDYSRLMGFINTVINAFANIKVGKQNQDLLEPYNDDEMLIRIESSLNFKKVINYELFHFNQIYKLLDKDFKSIHEVFRNQNQCKLCFDIDIEGIKNFNHYINQLDTILFNSPYMLSYKGTHIQRHVCGYQQINKTSLHIVYNIVIPLNIQREIAKFIKQSIEEVDIEIYYQSKSLRLPNCGKFTNDTFTHNKLEILSDSDLEDFYITCNFKHSIKYVTPIVMREDSIYPYSQEVSFPRSDVVDTLNQLQEHFTFINLHKVKETMFIFEVEDHQECPICKRKHYLQKNRIYKSISVSNKNRQITISCIRNRNIDESRRWKEPIKINFQNDEFYVQNTINLQDSMIPTHHIQFMSDLIKDEDLIGFCSFIKSEMNTGKTYIIDEMIKNAHYEGSLILSTRISFSNALLKRFKKDTIKVQSYQDIQGELNCNESNIICQIESLKRLKLGSVKLLIIDEIQAVFDQLYNCSTQIFNIFIDILKGAQTIVCLDADLNQSIIDCISHYVTIDKQVYYNSYKPFSGRKVVLYESLDQDENVQQFYNQLVNTYEQYGSVFSFCSSATVASKVFNTLIQTYPEQQHQFILFNGNNQQQDRIPCLNGYNDTQGLCICQQRCTQSHINTKKNAFTDVEQQFTKYSIIIYTSTLTIGVDCNIDKFQQGVHYLSKKSCKANQMVQAMHRFRRVQQHYIVYGNLVDYEFQKSADYYTFKFQQLYQEKDIKYYQSLNTEIITLQSYVTLFNNFIRTLPKQFILYKLNQMDYHITYDKQFTLTEENKSTSSKTSMSQYIKQMNPSSIYNHISNKDRKIFLQFQDDHLIEALNAYKLSINDKTRANYYKETKVDYSFEFLFFNLALSSRVISNIQSNDSTIRELRDFYNNATTIKLLEKLPNAKTKFIYYYQLVNGLNHLQDNDGEIKRRYQQIQNKLSYKEFNTFYTNYKKCKHLINSTYDAKYEYLNNVKDSSKITQCIILGYINEQKQVKKNGQVQSQMNLMQLYTCQCNELFSCKDCIYLQQYQLLQTFN